MESLDEPKASSSGINNETVSRLDIEYTKLIVRLAIPNKKKEK